MYEMNCHFQDAWTTKLACVKFMVNVDGKMLLLGEWQKFNKTRLRHLLNFDFQIIFWGERIEDLDLDYDEGWEYAFTH